MLGGNVFGWTVDESTGYRILDMAVEHGLTFIDTADIYSRWAPGHTGGESESLIGKWFARSGKRQQVVIATKVGLDMGGEKKGLSAAYIAKAVEDSLVRLQTDRIDLYQSHQDDANTPLEETLGAFDRLVQQGKVRFTGASNYSGERLTAALETSATHNLAAYQTLQPHYNMVYREPFESDLAPVALRYNLGVIPYFSLASGFLTGKYRTEEDLKDKARAGGVRKYMNPRGFAVVDALRKVAARLDSTAGRVALAWLIAQPTVTAPITSATSPEQLLDLAAAASLQLDEATLAELTAVSAPGL